MIHVNNSYHTHTNKQTNPKYKCIQCHTRQTNKHRTLDIYISIIKLIIHNLNTAGINKLTQIPQVHSSEYLGLTPIWGSKMFNKLHYPVSKFETT